MKPYTEQGNSGKSPILTKYLEGWLYIKEGLQKLPRTSSKATSVETKSNIVQSLLPGTLAATK